MASFAAQLKDKFLSLVDRVTGWGGCGTGAGRDKDVTEATKLPNVQQPVEIRSRDPVVGGGSVAGAN
ncbi:hypothetical protein BDA96_06G257000 [Sorghum bicolor]|uniref:Uncharacterized protein n=2 Tax=Sorghum bicolor TaxID=4558 RepID=A0A921QTS9_SORBI|nr:hypothetical protein BDA96_06G257000 [Sorghum bicolor]KXG27231.1 hypothetical protein SORBI_3006G234800 [Sorghum bicolor]